MKPESRYIDIYNHTLCTDSFIITSVEQRRLARYLQKKISRIENDHLLSIYLFLVKFLYTSHQYISTNQIEHRSVIALTGEITINDRCMSIYDQMWLYDWLDVQDYYGIDQSLIQPMKNLISFLRTDRHPAFSKNEYEETILRRVGY